MSGAAAAGAGPLRRGGGWTRRAAPGALAVAAALAFGAGCGGEPEVFRPNQEPNTRVSAGPPEASDTGYTVNLFWFGWDDDGFVDHYEIAWETPEDWKGPIYTNDSLFAVQASDTCCVEPLPEFGATLSDSVYQQFHTFYVRSVDNLGVPDPTPAFRSFNAKTIAPHTEISFGPKDFSQWGTTVKFKWTAEDDDGVPVAYRRALATFEQFQWDGQTGSTFEDLINWLDTLTFVPIGPGQYKDSLIWVYTEADSVEYPDLPTRDSQGGRALYVFAVRAIDDAGAEERVLEGGANARRFFVTESLNGPLLRMRSNVAGTWRSGESEEVREIFAGSGLRFEWTARPGQSGSPVVGFSYAVEDTAEWTPFSPNATEWPESIEGEAERLWFPETGPHAFFIRSIDLGGFITVLAAKLQVFSGPRFCPDEDRIILVVLDTGDFGALETDGIFPSGYRTVERGLVDYWFEGYSYQVFETRWTEEVDVGLLDCATTTVWFHGGAIRDGDGTILWGYHADPPNPLPSYVASGGNFFLVGVEPADALRYFDPIDEPEPLVQSYPVLFSSTLTDTTLAPHWAATAFGIARINESIRNTNPGTLAGDRLRVAKSAVPEYPDLWFDPLTWPNGPQLRGFGYYDRDIVPIPGAAEVIYTFNDTGLAVGVRRLTAPGPNGNTVYLGLHPYFVERPAFRQLLRAVLTEFGEVMNP